MNDLTTIFNDIYLSNKWLNSDGGTKSGPGSCIKYSKPFITYTSKLITEYNITTILDYGCGDLNLIKHVLDQHPDIKYTGVDISSIITDENKKLYPQHTFINSSIDQLNLNQNKFDLCIIKDVFQHISNNQILDICKYYKYFKLILVCNDFKDKNVDCIDGGYRGINLTGDPFNITPYDKFQFKSHKRNKEIIVINPYDITPT